MSQNSDEAVFVLPTYSEIGIFLNSIPEDTYKVSIHELEDPDAKLIIQEDLYMKSGGKRNRMKVCDVHSKLIMKTPTLPSVELEAVTCGVQAGDIEMYTNKLIIDVKSFNEALTIVTNRLKPGRKHGGRVYSYMALICNGYCYSIEAMRKKVESGHWRFPPT
ncbi:hypothetical protein [Nodularia sphaerocarpa]|uniref:hypothetical protein n=1 Tax=Nodularia sphaerocarpa TaxID=137816 RepID=UPI00232E65F6|nr:hypothetical protein [Nodularia sphaerocarpa]MDB9372335.1 hypothetical protein [Nodularia sphaerocarpa CS-585]MDB9377951.1 hypothetical protein [Nodularia sphaerocarpa CS-585A2]